MARDKLRILLADDHMVVRMGLSALIDKQSDMTVVGEATDGREAVLLAEKLKPDVTIMDILMPGMNGAESSAEILRHDPEAKILILTTFGSSPDVRRALDSGARGALTKDALQQELLDTVRRIAAGERVIDREIGASLAAEPTLSARQIEVLELVAKGFDNKEVAKLLGLSVDGVKKHLKIIFAALGAASRTEAVSIAMSSHLLTV